MARTKRISQPSLNRQSGRSVVQQNPTTQPTTKPSGGVPLHKTNIPSTAPDMDFSNIVQIFVGSDKEEFIAHPSILKRCPWFKARLSGNWAGFPEEVDLVEADPTAFKDYLTFLYNQFRSPDPHEITSPQNLYHRLIQAWILADSLSDSRSANVIIDEFDRVSDEYEIHHSAANVTLVFEHCAKESPMYRYVRDSFVYCCEADTMDHYHERDVPEEFFFAVAREMQRLVMESDRHRSVGDLFQSGFVMGCRYHMHDKSCPKEECENEESDDDDQDS